MPVLSNSPDAVYHRERRHYRITHGLCEDCGKAPPENGRTRCRACLDRRNKDRRDDRKFYKSIGICHVCKINPILGDESICPECSAKKKTYAENYVFSDETLKNRHMYGKQYYQDCKARGICPTCGKRKAAPGRVRCEICLDKNARKASLTRNATSRDWREEHGLCGQCGKRPVAYGTKLCAECYAKSIENLKKARESPKFEEWKRINQQSFYNRMVSNDRTKQHDRRNA